MKGPLERTKVVLRHLPPSISQSMLVDQIDPKFSGRYNWLSFCPGNSSRKNVVHSRAYINFNKAEDVVDFAEFFNGHVFVNEKGTQYKAAVEYAPSQSVPKKWSKKDGREGTILKDPEYAEFLEIVGKPVEHLPSAEIQLERREAEKAGKEALIITPLMHFIRQKRASSSGPRRSLNNGKSVKRIGRRSSDNISSVSSKQPERRRVSTTMYVVRDATTALKGKDKSFDPFISKREHQRCFDKTTLSGGSFADEVSTGETGSSEAGKKNILLLKGKDRDLSNVKFLSTRNLRPNPRREIGEKIIKSILQQSSQLERSIQSQPSNIRILSKSRNGNLDDKISVSDIKVADKPERRTRNKDRPDRGVWTPLRKSDGLVCDGSSSSSSSFSSAAHSIQIPPPSEGSRVEQKVDASSARGEVMATVIARNFHSPIENGSSVHLCGRRPSQVRKDTDVNVQEPKSAKHGASSGYYSHEKQVWIQKSSAT